MKKWLPAEIFRERMTEQEITVKEFSEFAGLSPSTIYKWLRQDLIPAEAMQALNNFAKPDIAEFQSLLVRTTTSLERFCDDTGTTHNSPLEWMSTNAVPKWAIVVLKQKLVIKKLQQLLADSKTGTTGTTQTPTTTHSKVPPVAPNNDTHTDAPQNIQIDPGSTV